MARSSKSKTPRASTSPKRKPPKNRRPRIASGRRVLLWALFALTLAGLGTVALVLAYFSSRIDETLAGRSVSLSSRIYPASLELRVGRRLGREEFLENLEALGYARAARVTLPGEYREAGTQVFFVRPHRAWIGGPTVIDAALEVRLERNTLAALRVVNGKVIESAWLPPLPFAEIRGISQASRRLVRLVNIPKPNFLVNAILAIEDKRFYLHPGLDLRSIFRAISINLTRGERAQGGSTITQQLAKNLFLSHEKSFQRKMKELFFALALELRFSKDAILEMYLNEIYLGQRGASAICGVGQAAYVYFSKEVSELSLEEAALLAGLIQAPNYYAPDRHPERAEGRRNVVLAKMFEQQMITGEQQKMATKLPVRLRPAPYLGRTAPYVVDYITDQVSNSLAEFNLAVNGYAIETSIDMRIQRKAEEALVRGLERLQKNSIVPLEGATMVVNSRTGSILAIVGGRNYAQSQFNRATQAKRQPGSVIKPLVILGALHLRGHALVPSSLLSDAPLTLEVDGKSWSPQNNDHDFHGDITLREVIEQSLNVSTVRLAMDTGLKPVMEFLATLGLPPAKLVLPSSVLGATEATLFDIASAYTAVAGDGRVRPLRGILRVLDNDGEVVFEPSPTVSRATSAGAAFLVRDMMRGVVDRGTAKNVRTLGYTFDVAAKTGTTSDNRDAWFIGFDRDYLCVVWVGNDEGAPVGFSGSRAALPIWVDLMKSVRQQVRPDADPMPVGIMQVEMCQESRELAGPLCRDRFKEVFWQDHTPTESCSLHRSSMHPPHDHPRLFPQLVRRLFHRNED